jgi:hypothetical protein
MTSVDMRKRLVGMEVRFARPVERPALSRRKSTTRSGHMAQSCWSQDLSSPKLMREVHQPRCQSGYPEGLHRIPDRAIMEM